MTSRWWIQWHVFSGSTASVKDDYSAVCDSEAHGLLDWAQFSSVMCPSCPGWCWTVGPRPAPWRRWCTWSSTWWWWWSMTSRRRGDSRWPRWTLTLTLTLVTASRPVDPLTMASVTWSSWQCWRCRSGRSEVGHVGYARTAWCRLEGCVCVVLIRTWATASRRCRRYNRTHPLLLLSVVVVISK